MGRRHRQPNQSATAERVLTSEVACGYRPTMPGAGFWGNDAQTPNLARMIQDVEAMVAHPRIEAAMTYYKSGIAGATVVLDEEGGPTASSPAVGDFALAEARRWWRRARVASQRSYEYGRGASEVVYEREGGHLRLKAAHPFNAMDCRPLVLSKEYAGVRVSGGAGGGPLDLPGPRLGLPSKAFWFAPFKRYSRWYGVPRVYAAWRPWRRLAGQDGAEDIIDGGVYRFAFQPPIGRFPAEDQTPNPSMGYTPGGGGVRIRGRDIMRNMLEELKAGGSVAMSSRRDEKGNLLWDVQWPTGSLDVGGLLAYTDDLEKAISLGVGVPPELLEASDVGSGYSGRMIPLEAFTIQQQSNAEELLAEWYEQIGLPLLKWNFGPSAWARLAVEDLRKTRARMAQAEKGGGPCSPPPPEQGPPKPGASLFSTLDVEAGEMARFATEAASHPTGKPWKGPSGRWFVKRESDGHVIPAAGPDDTGDGKARGGGRGEGEGEGEKKAGIGERAAGLVAGAKAWLLSRVGEPVWNALPAPARSLAAGLYGVYEAVEHVLEAGVRTSQAMVRNAARERGLPEEHVERVARITAVADGLLRWTANIPVAHEVIHVLHLADGWAGFGLAKVGFYMPFGSAAYLAYSTARNPLATVRAAGRLMRGDGWGEAHGHGHGGPKKTELSTATRPAATPEDAARLLGGMGGADADWLEALVMAGLDAGATLDQSVARAAEVLARHPSPPEEEADDA